MFTSYDKAIAAVVGSILSAIALKIGVDPETIPPDVVFWIAGGVSAVLSGVLTYLLPNKDKRA